MSPRSVILGVALCLVSVPAWALSEDKAVEGSVPQAAPTMEVQASLSLRVDDRALALDAVVADAQARGGWFNHLSEQAVSLRVPADQVEDFLDATGARGQVIDRSYNATDRAPEIEDAQRRLRARRDVLDQFMAVLETASPKAIVRVEREVTGVVAEIEQLQGRLRVLDDRARFAAISVDFQYRDRRAPVRMGDSSFGWINTLNVADLLDATQYGHRAAPGRVGAAAPDGFAPYKAKGRFQAISPDDCIYRVTSFKNKPVADLAFWSEALRTRMDQAGYHLVAETEVQAGGTTGTLLELGAANGTQDQAYVVALFIDGGRIVVVEATGEAEAFAARRDAVVAAVNGLEM